jgi:hypothetical protein
MCTNRNVIPSVAFRGSGWLLNEKSELLVEKIDDVT